MRYKKSYQKKKITTNTQITVQSEKKKKIAERQAQEIPPWQGFSSFFPVPTKLSFQWKEHNNRHQAQMNKQKRHAGQNPKRKQGLIKEEQPGDAKRKTAKQERRTITQTPQWSKSHWLGHGRPSCGKMSIREVGALSTNAPAHSFCLASSIKQSVAWFASRGNHNELDKSTNPITGMAI